MGTGGGAFRRGARIRVGTLPSAIAAADLDGDGVTDLAMSDFRSGVVWVLLGRRGGGFRRPLGLAVGTGPAAPSGLAVADLNGDRVPDIAVADFRRNRVAVLPGAGGGRFHPARTVPAGPGPAALAVADLTGDGRPDVVVADTAVNAVTVLAGSADNAIGAPAPSEAAGPGRPAAR
jgi:hypothetical protein